MDYKRSQFVCLNVASKFIITIVMYFITMNIINIMAGGGVNLSFWRLRCFRNIELVCL